MSMLSNNGLHQTGRVGAAASRPVVEARPAGEAKCYADEQMRENLTEVFQCCELH